MPCYDDRGREESYEATRELKLTNKKLEKIEAMLCMVLTTLEEENELGHFKELFNYKESGVSREELMLWWREHREADAKRRREEYEAAEKARKKAEREAERQKVLEKLSPEERKLLGVK